MPDAVPGLEAFLSSAGWGRATPHPVTGDASTRRYTRLAGDDGASAILMECPDDPDSLARFCAVGALLDGLSLSVPTPIAVDRTAGVALFEDFGDAVFARLLAQDPSREAQLYGQAVDALLVLRRAPTDDGMPKFRSGDYLAKAQASLTWYPGIDGGAESAILAELETVLHQTDAAPRALSLRDYHAENLVWLPGRTGVKQVGLLDFQDAVWGHPAYDLVSLLWDARRDVGAEVRRQMMNRYIRGSGLPEDRFRADAAILNAQRNLRVLTQFARLVRRDGKPVYLTHMPRVWRNLIEALSHPALSGLSAAIRDHVAPPEPALLSMLRSQCQTSPAA